MKTDFIERLAWVMAREHSKTTWLGFGVPPDKYAQRHWKEYIEVAKRAQFMVMEEVIKNDD